jgi:hypothetical protein
MSFQPDPIVQILQLAARRGFEIMREREQITGTKALKHDAPDGDQGDGNGSAEGDPRNAPARSIEDADTTS